MSEFDGLKLVGHCTCCDGECYEITERYPMNHAFAGQPRKVKAQYDTARRMTFLLSTGSRMDITMCDECCAITPEDYPKLWAKCLRSWAWECEPAYRAAHDLPPDPPEKVAQRWAWLKEMTNVCILDLCYATKERRYHGERHECRMTHEGTHGQAADIGTH